MYYQPNIAAHAAGRTGLAQGFVNGAFLSLLLWSLIITTCIRFA